MTTNQSPSKHPPEFLPGMGFKAWKNKINMWVRICGYPQKDQALVVLLESFKHHPDAARTLETLEDTQLHVDTGMKILLDTLESVFAEEDISEKWGSFLGLYQYEKTVFDDI